MNRRPIGHVAIVALASIAALVTVSPASFAEEAFWDLGNAFNPSDLSADGWYAAGYAPLSGQGALWYGTTDHFEIGGMNATGVSDDASTVVGNVSGAGALETAARWTEADGWVELEPFPEAASCDAFFTSSWGVNGDGSVIVGLAWVPACRAHAFRWTEATGMVDLGSTVVDRSSRANDVSSDGETVVGWQDASDGFRQGAFWREDPVRGSGWNQTLLFENHPDFGVFQVGEAQAATPDGSVIVGGSTAVAGEAYRWTGGEYVEPIGGLTGFNWRSIATAVSDDGGVIVGFSGFGFDRAGFIWTEAMGLVNITDFLIGLGIVELDGWNLNTPTGISSDGTVITGFGNPPGSFDRHGWRVDLNAINFTFQAVDAPKPVLADSNGLSFDVIQPNPFQASTRITYSVPTQDRVTLAVYDVAGRSVRTLVDRTLSPGRHTVSWDGRDTGNRRVAAGVYFVRATGSGQVETERITLLR